MFKKTLTIVLAAVMLLGLMVPALAQSKTQVVLWHTFTR